jgi:hypothetical protein
MLYASVDQIRKDVEERHYRGTVTPQDVADLLEAIALLSARERESADRLADLEAALADLHAQATDTGTVTARKVKAACLDGDISEARLFRALMECQGIEVDLDDSEE